MALTMVLQNPVKPVCKSCLSGPQSRRVSAAAVACLLLVRNDGLLACGPRHVQGRELVGSQIVHCTRGVLESGSSCQGHEQSKHVPGKGGERRGWEGVGKRKRVSE